MLSLQKFVDHRSNATDKKFSRDQRIQISVAELIVC